MVLTAPKLYPGHDYVIQSVPKAFIMEVLFMDRFENISLPRISELQTKFTYDGPGLLVLDGHSTYVTLFFWVIGRISNVI
jgi:hypothetical protein